MTPTDRKRIWRHNSFLGYAVRMRKTAQEIIDSDSASPQAKQLAHHIRANAEDLQRALKERIDPK